MRKTTSPRDITRNARVRILLRINGEVDSGLTHRWWHFSIAYKIPIKVRLVEDYL
jgi:hypothetical protein